MVTVILKIMYLKPFQNFTYSVVFKNSVSELFLSIYGYYMFFPPSLKLQYCRTIVLLNKLKLFKPLFQKRPWSCDFPPRKTPVSQKHLPISRQEKMAFSTPRRVVLGHPSLPPDSVRTGGRTLTSQPNFLGSIGYQICLAMVFRWRASLWVSAV